MLRKAMQAGKLKVQSYSLKLKSLRNWIVANKAEFFLLVGILLTASFLRLWRLDEYLPFLGDEGRDVRVVRRFLTDFDLMFVGPRTSIGDMYLGPLYYYLIAPFLLLWRFSPVGPAFFVALLGMATVGFVWFVAREWFGKVAGLTSAFGYALSPVVITLSKHSWNPNIMPFFSLLSIYSIWRVWKRGEYKWLVVLGVAMAFVLQSHYLGLLLIPTILLFWLLTILRIRNYKLPARNAKQSVAGGEIRNFAKNSLLSLGIFAILMSPLALFDAKHGWRNFAAMQKFFTERQTTVSAKPWNAIDKLWPIWQEQVTTRLVVAKNPELGVWVGALLLISFVAVIVLRRNNFFASVLSTRKPLAPFLLIVLWILVGLIGLGVYKQHIYDHYFGFMFTAPFLLIAALLQEMWDRKGKVIVIGIVIILAWINLQEVPLKYPPQRQMQRVQEIDRRIIEESGGKPFNFGLIAERNYEEGYLYFFELMHAPVVEIDALKSTETITDQLFVVCEDSPKPDKLEVCNPINHPKAEIANFGWAKIESEAEIRGVRLFKLVHTQ